MRKLVALVLGLLLLSGLIAGCGGGNGVHRITGLSPDKVVATFHERAKAQKLEEAALYISPTSLTAIRGVGGFLKNDLGLSDVLSSNLLMVKLIAQTGDFAVVVATLQDGVNSANVTIKPVGLERIDGEWYIVDTATAYRDAKYKLLQNLLASVL